VTGLIRPAKVGSKLHQHAEQWERGQVRSFAVCAIYEDGTITADFDIEDIKNVGELNALGGPAPLHELLSRLGLSTLATASQRQRRGRCGRTHPHPDHRFLSSTGVQVFHRNQKPTQGD
jgi:hypothetical protein